MIILTATMHPLGNSAQAYPLLEATITNRTRTEDLVGTVDRYMAHVCARPNKWLGVSGYEADVEVRGHKRSDGVVPVILAVLNAANGSERSFPEAQRLNRVTIEDAADFERRLRGFIP